MLDSETQQVPVSGITMSKPPWPTMFTHNSRQPRLSLSVTKFTLILKMYPVGILHIPQHFTEMFGLLVSSNVANRLRLTSQAEIPVLFFGILFQLNKLCSSQPASCLASLKAELISWKYTHSGQLHHVLFSQVQNCNTEN